jgi:hypothetical protein
MDTDLDPVQAPAPDPALFFSGFQNANQSSKIKVTKNSKKLQNRRKQNIQFFCLLVKGNGSGDGRPKWQQHTYPTDPEH